MALTEQKQGTESGKIPRRTRKFSLTNAGKYSINNLYYPEGISVDPDKLHYITFAINVRGKSKVFANHKPSANAAMGSSGENRLDPTKLGRVVTGSAIVGSAGSTEALSLGRTLGSKTYSQARQAGASAAQADRKASLVQAGTSAASGVIGGVAASLAVQPDTTYRIADVITLHVPHAPRSTTSVEYGDVELGTLAGVLAGGSSAVDTTRSALATESVKALILAGSSLPNSLSDRGGITSPDQVKAATQLAEGQSLNPFREVLFKAVGFRRFQFSFKFMPKSKAESDNVFNIIKTFRYHQLPELSQGSLYLIHPSEFQIQYYFNGVENDYFNKIGTCALESVDVVYGGEDKFASFRDGAPTEVTMNLVFKELATLTRDDVTLGL